MGVSSVLISQCRSVLIRSADSALSPLLVEWKEAISMSCWTLTLAHYLRYRPNPMGWPDGPDGSWPSERGKNYSLKGGLGKTPHTDGPKGQRSLKGTPCKGLIMKQRYGFL